MKKNLSLLVVIAVLATTILTACGPDQKAAFNSKNSTSGGTENTSKDGAKPATQDANSKDTSVADKSVQEKSDDGADPTEKINYYVDCINNFSERALGSYDRYLSWVPKNGPTGKESIVYGLYTLNGDPQKCIDGLKTARGLAPSYAELDAAGEVYGVALSKVSPLIAEANDYYEQGNYKDDNMAKGKEIHPKLIDAFKALDDSDQKMRTELGKIQDQIDEKELAMLEKEEGRKLPFLLRNTMYLAKKLLAEGNVADLSKINLDSYKKALDEYEKVYNEMKDYIAANKSEADSAFISMFPNDAKDFLTSAKELMRRVRDKTPYETGEKMNLGVGSGWMVDGSPDQLLYKYNALVNASNSLRF